MITHASLCTGYGGLDMAAATWLGVDLDTLWHAEVDADACAVLKASDADVPNIGDITAADWHAQPRPFLLTMGPPCQPVSAAGRQLGVNDPRWLWPACRTAIGILRPRLIVFENVRNLISIERGAIWRGILDDFRELGYAVRWTILGACRVGAPHHRHRVFLVAALMSGPAPEAVRVDAGPCGAPRRGGRTLLPSPQARDGDATRGSEGDAAYWERRRVELGRTNGMPLGAAVVLLPTPSASDTTGAGHAAQGGLNLRTAVTLLPTPQSRDGDDRRGAPGAAVAAGRLASGRRNLPDAASAEVAPTPRASDASNGGPNRGIAAGDVALSSAVQPSRWGAYADAVDLWERLHGPAPEPVEPNTRGTGVRLAPAFPEWMMGLPAGYLSDAVGRGAALRLAGNGVCPQQGVAALSPLMP